MKLALKNTNLSKSSTILILIVSLWFYISVCLGYYLSTVFYNFFDKISKTNLSEMIKFRKKFNLKNIKIFIGSYVFNFLKNWAKRIEKKLFLTLAAIYETIKSLKIFRKKFKSVLKFKYNFRLIKNLLPVFWQCLQIFYSFVNEMLLINNIINFIIKFKQFLLLIIYEYPFIIKLIHVLYFFLLGIFGILLGFLLGVYKRDEEIYIFSLLLLLEIFYNSELEDILFQSDKVHYFCKLYSKTVPEQASVNPLRLLILKKPNKNFQIPLPILSDPFLYIDVDFIWEESKNYKFELFKFYQNVNKKMKY
jgi:hypothetical protein